MGANMANKGCRFPAEPLTRAEVEALVAKCSPTSNYGIRNAALIVTLYRSGLRCAEALSLLPKDLNAEQRTITVLRGKGHRPRVVAMDDWGWSRLSQWMDRRRQIGLDGKHPVFCTIGQRGGKPLVRPYVAAVLRRLAKAAGVEKRVHAHGLRHSFASEMAQEGAPVPAIADLLGHKNVAMTWVYLHRLNPADSLRWAIDRGPREKSQPESADVPRRRRKRVDN